MSKKIYIPARLQNAAVDEEGNRLPVAGAEDIDAGEGKTQQQVNEDVDDALTFHQQEINALDGQNYVTVTAYSSLPATGAVNTIYRVSSYDGTQVDATKYAEYAWNGSAYMLLDVKTQVGEVFDISQYRAVGGTLATFDDLADALDSGNNVPSGLRKGGMSVKFVQNSDNKYVIYRLMATSFSANENDWKGDVSISQNAQDGAVADINIGNTRVETFVKGDIKATIIVDNAALNYAKYNILTYYAKAGEKLFFVNNGASKINILAKGTDDSAIIIDGVNAGSNKSLTLSKDIKSLGVFTFAAGDVNYDVYRQSFVEGIADCLSRITPDTGRDSCSDLNNAPINSVLAFTTLSNVGNTPTYNAATLLTYNIMPDTLPYANTVQILTEVGYTSPKRVFVRCGYGEPLVWYDWKDITNADVPIKVDNVAYQYYNYNIIPYHAEAGETLTLKNNGITVNVLARYTDSTTGILKGSMGSGINKIQLTKSIKSLGVFATEAGDVDIKILSSPNTELANKTDIPFTSLSSFLRIGVIGDSYASGWLNVGGSYRDWYNISWVQQMARMNGVTGVNFSKGGLTTRSWLTDSQGLAKLNSEDVCDLYYIVLGINDAYSLGVSYLGTIADCTDTPQSNPDTFYGNFGKILDDIATKAPHAKVIISTMAHSDNTADQFNNAIIEIANHFELPLIKQREDVFFTSDYWENKVEGHPTVQLYGGMAQAIQRLTLKCIVENVTYFNDIYPSSLPN